MTSSVAGQNVMIGLDSRRADHLLAPVLHTPKSIAADRAARSEVVELMSRLGLGHVAGVDAALLPHGTQRLVEIARAAASRPRVLLLDEPAAGLIGPELEHLGETIRIIARGGVSVLIVEHNLPLVFGIAEVVTVLHDGSVIATGTPSEISADDLVRSVYVGTEYRDEARSVDPRSV